jgi:hypothetical protein
MASIFNLPKWSGSAKSDVLDVDDVKGVKVGDAGSYLGELRRYQAGFDALAGLQLRAKAVPGLLADIGDSGLAGGGVDFVTHLVASVQKGLNCLRLNNSTVLLTLQQPVANMLVSIVLAGIAGCEINPYIGGSSWKTRTRKASQNRVGCRIARCLTRTARSSSRC